MMTAGRGRGREGAVMPGYPSYTHKSGRADGAIELQPRTSGFWQMRMYSTHAWSEVSLCTGPSRRVLG